MNLEMFSAWVLVGLGTGGLAAVVLRHGSYGLPWDLALGLVGSGTASVILTALAAAPESATLFTTGPVAFAGAALVILAQRKIYA